MVEADKPLFLNIDIGLNEVSVLKLVSVLSKKLFEFLDLSWRLFFIVFNFKNIFFADLVLIL